MLAPIYHTLPPLDPDQCETRLVYLHRGSIAEPLECTLAHASLQIDAPPYEALSYTWRTPATPDEGPLSVPLRVNSTAVHVLHNLGDALRCLRRPDRTRTLWIDFLCINQRDAVERARQVRRMDKIFECATQVVIFLGGTGSDVPEALECVSQLADARDEEHLRELLGYAADSAAAVRKVHGLAQLLRNDWFSRVSVLPSLVLLVAC